jgi:NADP-dependent 3-hydroxy acid dehydrogenase YdfG
VKLFAAKGWKVIATMRNPEKETELGKIPNVILLLLDVTDTNQINSAVEKATLVSDIDIVFNNVLYSGLRVEGY